MSIQEQIDALEAERKALEAKREALAFLSHVPTEEEVDLAMLRLIGSRAERRLAECRAAGKSGWLSRPEAELQVALSKNVSEQNYLDAMLLSAMLAARASIK